MHARALSAVAGAGIGPWTALGSQQPSSLVGSPLPSAEQRFSHLLFFSD